MASLAELIAASLAANPYAAGNPGTLFTYGGNNAPNTPSAPAMPSTPGATMTADEQAAWYQQMLGNDPQLAAALAAIDAQQQAYQGQMTAAEQQALEQYGAIPAGLADQYASLVTPTVQGIADQATQGGVSTVAQLAKAYAQNQTSTLDNLAGRGMLRSGATGVRENNDLQNYNVAGYNALNSLLGNLGQNYSTYLGQQDQLHQQSTTASSDALTRIINQINAGVVSAPTTATAAPGATTTPSPPPAAPAAPTAAPGATTTTTPKVSTPPAAPSLSALGVGASGGTEVHGFGRTDF